MVRPCPRAHKGPYICGAMWNVEDWLAMVSPNIYKPTQMNKGLRFEIKNETENQG